MEIVARDFQSWLNHPLDGSVINVRETMEMLCQHPVAHDPAALSGHFDFTEVSFPNISGTRIFTEEQGVHEFYIQDGKENEVDPDVFFVSSIDLTEFGGPRCFTPTLACDNFHSFIWQCICLLYTSPSPRDQRGSRMPSSA